MKRLDLKKFSTLINVDLEDAKSLLEESAISSPYGDREIMEVYIDEDISASFTWSWSNDTDIEQYEDEDDEDYEFRNIVIGFHCEIRDDRYDASENLFKSYNSSNIYDGIEAPGEMVWNRTAEEDFLLFVEECLEDIYSLI